MLSTSALATPPVPSDSRITCTRRRTSIGSRGVPSRLAGRSHPPSAQGGRSPSASRAHETTLRSNAVPHHADVVTRAVSTGGAAEPVVVKRAAPQALVVTWTTLEYGDVPFASDACTRNEYIVLGV